MFYRAGHIEFFKLGQLMLPPFPGRKMNVGAKNYCLRTNLLGHWRQMLSYEPSLVKEVTD